MGNYCPMRNCAWNLEVSYKIMCDCFSGKFFSVTAGWAVQSYSFGQHTSCHLSYDSWGSQSSFLSTWVCGKNCYISEVSWLVSLYFHDVVTLIASSLDISFCLPALFCRFSSSHPVPITPKCYFCNECPSCPLSLNDLWILDKLSACVFNSLILRVCRDGIYMMAVVS